MSSGYRDATLAPQCSACLRAATGVCRRCGRPLCEDHVHGEGRRCPACEAAFARMTPLWAGAALLASLVAAPAYLATGRPRLADPSLFERFQRRRRRRFLAKQRADRA